MPGYGHSSPPLARLAASCPTTRARRSSRPHCAPAGPLGPALPGDVPRDRGLVRQSHRSTWERRPRPPAPSCSPSTTTVAPKRTSPDGNTTRPTWSIRSGARSTRCCIGAAPSSGADLEGSVVGVVGDSSTVAARWTHPLAFCFIDGGHGAEPAWADFRGWAPRVAVGGWLAIHDVFPDPADGGRPPYELFCAALGLGRIRRGRRMRQPARPAPCGAAGDLTPAGASAAQPAVQSPAAGPVQCGSARSSAAGRHSPRNSPAAGVVFDRASAASTMAPKV